MTCDYLQKTKQVHHLLYAYSSSNVQSEEHYLERYPGDQYVDILGFDHYLKGREQKNVEQYKIDFERKKIVQTVDFNRFVNPRNRTPRTAAAALRTPGLMRPQLLKRTGFVA